MFVGGNIGFDNLVGQSAGILISDMYRKVSGSNLGSFKFSLLIQLVCKQANLIK